MGTHNKLGGGILLQDPGEDICNQIDALLQTPPPDEHEQLGVGVLLEASPLLSLALEICPPRLEFLVDGRDLSGH